MVSEHEMTAPPARCDECGTMDDVEWVARLAKHLCVCCEPTSEESDDETETTNH